MEQYFISGLALAGFGYFIYKCLSKTPIIDAGGQTDNPSTDKTRFLAQYGDITDQWTDPMNTISNIEKLTLEKTEEGPYGLPRFTFRGAGNSKLVTNSENYISL